jgi:phosphoglycolate phosphatase-like HAD superfamily hydrolase
MAVDTSRIRLLCFDIDGTLSDTDNQFVRRLANGLRWARFLFPAGDPRPFARRVVMATESPGNRLFGFADRLGIDGALAAAGDLAYRIGLGRTPQAFSLVPGVHSMLDRLRPHYSMAIVSARGQRTTQRFLDQCELATYFGFVAAAQTCRHTKPYPDPIQWVAAQAGIIPEQCLMIGDTTIDIRAAKAAGAQSVGVLCGFGVENELRRCDADLILKTTAELAEVLLGEDGC